MSTTNPHPRSLVRVRLGAGLAMLLVLAACSKAAGSVRPSESALGSPRPSSPAHVRILAPTDGQVFKGTSVKVPVKLVMPLILGIMPAMFVVIAGPGIIRLAHSFLGTHV